MVWPHEPVREATDTEATVHRSRGGSAANVAAFAAPSHPTRFIGCVGRDPAADRLTAELASHGVELRVQRRGATGTVVVLIDPDGERTMFPDRGAARLLEELDGRWLEDLAHLHVPAYSFTAGPTAATAVDSVRRLRDGGRRATVSVDLSSTGALRRHGEARLLDLLAGLDPDLLFANEDEARLLPRADGRLTENGTVIVKRGARPTTALLPGGREVEVEVEPVDGVRDLTGAGDAFAAGCLTAYLRGAGVREACEHGNVCAARVLRAPGASAGAPPDSPASGKN